VKADKCAATDWDSRWCTGHHVVVACAVVALVVADGAYDGVFISDACKLWQVFADLDTCDVGIDGLEFTANFDGSFRLWVEGFEVGWPAIHPDQDTA
jgi:hypothetical protein